MTNDQKNFTYALERAIAHSSLEVLNGETQLYSLVADYLGGSPQSRQSMNLLRNAIACGIPARMYGAASKDAATQNITIATCRKLLVDNYGIGEEAAERFMWEFAAALGWQVATAPPAQPKEESPLKNTVTGTPKQEPPRSGTSTETMKGIKRIGSSVPKEKLSLKELLSDNTNDPEVQCHLGWRYYAGKGGAQQDYGEAVRWYRKAAEQGHARAKNELGMRYYEGKGVPQNFAEAVRLFYAAAEQGYAAAQNNLAACYYDGKGVQQDCAEAIRWYRKAAEQGHAAAQNSLATCYYDGKGARQDYAEAVLWYRKAVEQGHVRAQNQLGICYYSGLGVPQDYAEAARWFQKAAEQGSSGAQHNLGYSYYLGRGVTKNLTEARKWLEKAAGKGYKNAIDVLNEMNRNGE